MAQNGSREIADALVASLQSPNVMDSNMESANVVDGLDKVAWAIQQHALAVDAVAAAILAVAEALKR